MLVTRVIPLLLLNHGGLYKGVRFKKHKYVGDPINAIKIFNEKEADELILLDIGASIERRGPDFSLLQDIASEIFMPFAYGGGLSQLDQIKRLFKLGAEKIVLNSAALQRPALIAEAVKQYGSQSIVVSIDIKQNFWGQYHVYSHSGTYNTKRCPWQWSNEVVSLGAGEILLNVIDRDGTRKGYDITLGKKFAQSVPVPVILSGGASDWNDIIEAAAAGISAVAVGTYFVFYGDHEAVLIQYPTRETLNTLFRSA